MNDELIEEIRLFLKETDQELPIVEIKGKLFKDKNTVQINLYGPNRLDKTDWLIEILSESIEQIRKQENKFTTTH